MNALDYVRSVAADDTLVMVHDAVRPCTAAADVERVVAAARGHSDGAILAAPVTDTLKRGGLEGRIEETVVRDRLWRAFTPQVFPLGALHTALTSAITRGISVTDEAQAMEQAGARPRLVEGSADNRQDHAPRRPGIGGSAAWRRVDYRIEHAETVAVIRVGHGYDAHRFAPGARLVLGGVAIEFDRGLEGHSDGDVLIHALCDAALGAAGLGDIGKHFPDSSPEFAGIDSRILLRRVVILLDERGYGIVNADVTVVAQAPRLAPYIDEMRGKLAADLRVESGRVNIKATTTEGMGFAGRGEGIAAHSVVLIETR